MAAELLQIVKHAQGEDEWPERLEQAAKLLDSLNEEQREAAFEYQARRARLRKPGGAAL